MNIASFNSQPRGLHNFIAEIRSSKNKDDEHKRIDKELANIRQKFAQSSLLNAYQKKKYVWKMCYIHMLGYDVDFGHLEFISLLGATKFQEKSVGYMAVSLMLRPTDELMTLAINSMRNDIVGYLHHGKTLALAAVSNIGGYNLAEALVADVSRLIVGPMDDKNTSSYQLGPGEVDFATQLQNKALVCKKASLCLLRLFRTNNECVDLSEWVRRLGKLLEDRDLGVITSAMSLLLGFASHSVNTFEPLVPFAISILNRLVINRTCPPDYMYYHIPCPWLQVKSIRFLQLYRMPGGQESDMLFDVLHKIMNQTEVSDSVNKSNADHSILFEAINLLIAYGPDAPTELRSQCITLLGRFIGVKDANIRYLGLDAMTRLARLEGPRVVQMHQRTVLESLRDADVSVRKRALDLAFVMVDEKNAQEVLGELVTILAASDSVIKEDMVVKIAILAERHSVGEMRWFVDTMNKVVLVAGDFVSEPVWHRVVILITNDPDCHEYAAEKMLMAVQSKWAHETAVALAGYLLGEIGVNICERPNMSGSDQFAALHQHFSHCSANTQAILLTCYVKLVNLYPDTRDDIADVFRKLSTSSQLELQQRACEYLALSDIGAEIMENVLNAMPAYAERENPLLTLNEPEKETTDKSVRTMKDRGPDSQAALSESSVDEEPADGEEEEEVELERSSGPSKTQAVAVDLLSLDESDDVDADVDAFDADNADESAEVGISPNAVPHLRRWFNEAVSASPAQRALLYEDAYISVNITSEFRLHQGRISLFLTNRTNGFLRDLSVTVPSVDYLRVKLQDPSSAVGPGEEARVAIAVECVQPFAEVPAFEVAFTSQKPRSIHTYPLRLPITAASFFEPLPSDKPTYMARWKALEADRTEVQEIFKSSRTVDANFVNHIRTNVIPALHIGLAAGLDNENTVTGSCSFRANGSEGPVVIGAMMRLEADMANGRFRITVRAKHAVISQALKNVLQAQLV